jgi:hypothetical protein
MIMSLTVDFRQMLEWSGRGRGEPVVMTERTASTS